VEWKGNIAGINEMRRHYANYLKGLPNIKDFRLQLVTLKSVEEIGSVLDVIQSTYQGFQFEPRKVEIFQHAWGCSQL
jgi:tRNA-dihydrouridine synthase